MPENNNLRDESAYKVLKNVREGAFHRGRLGVMAKNC